MVQIKFITISTYTIYIDGPEAGDVHLDGRDYGRVETFVSGSWQPVGNGGYTWSVANSEVVCRELGYNSQ